MEIYHIFNLTVGIKNPFSVTEDIHQKIFFPEFHEIPTLPGGGELIMLQGKGVSRTKN